MAYRPRVTLSKSSIGTYNDCQRKWALHYQAYRTPAQIRREVLFQKKLMGSFALVGQVVDDAITYCLRKYQAQGEFPKQLRRGAERLLQQYIDESDRWKYLHDSGTEEPEEGRRQPIDRCYFGPPFSQEEREKLIDEIMSHVDTWFGSQVPNILIESGVQNWEVPIVGHMPCFQHNKITIWSKYDFILRTADETVIFDWKTGRVSQETEKDIREQLHTYAQYAMSDWNANPAGIKLYGVWLGLGAKDCLVEYKFDPNLLENLKREWEANHEMLVHQLTLAGPNFEHLLDVFPVTSQVYKCKGCKFHICEGRDRLEE